MSATEALLAVVAVGLITYSARAGLIVLLADKTLPPPMLRALRYVGPAVLSALVVTFLAGGEGRSGIDTAEVAAVVTAIVVARWRKNLILALAAAMSILWLVSAAT